MNDAANLDTSFLSSGAPRRLFGYAWPNSARPGDTLHFRVNAEFGGQYSANLVRIICADSLSKPSPYREVEVPSSFDGRYEGRRQPIYTGSYVELGGEFEWHGLDSFTIETCVFPTALSLPAAGVGGDPVRSMGPQHLVSCWDEGTQTGWALLLDEAGRPAFWHGTGGARFEAAMDRSLVQDRWYRLTATCDRLRGVVTLFAENISFSPGEAVGSSTQSFELPPLQWCSVTHVPLLRFAAASDSSLEAGRLPPLFCFNGRLDQIRISGSIPGTDSRAAALSSEELSENSQATMIGCWDFGAGIDTIDVLDVSGNGHNGKVVNLALRGVTGVSWDGSSNDWREKPEHYSAIHFHDDDLYDAEWKADFSFTIPDDLPSGIYAARLSQDGSEDHIPFFVAPEKGAPTSNIAFLVPTLSYTAYTNHEGFWSQRMKERIYDPDGTWSVRDVDLYPSVLKRVQDGEYLLEKLGRNAVGKGLYHNHTDGSYCSVASPLYPNMTLKPKSQNWGFVVDTYITAWLEHVGLAYDVITDDLLHEEGAALLAGYDVVITGNHPEYCTEEMLNAIDAYQRQGGSWMYLGGNGYFWRTVPHAQLPGAIEVRKDFLYPGIHKPPELRHAFNGKPAGLWVNNGRSPQRLMGVGSVQPWAFRQCVGYLRLPDSRDPRAEFIFDGVGNDIIGDYGIIGGGAAGQETDEIDFALGTPSHALHLARSLDFPLPLAGPEGLIDEKYLDNARMPRADIVYFELPQGGGVFSVGSMAWIGSLSHNDYDNDCARITENVLRKFADAATS